MDLTYVTLWLNESRHLPAAADALIFSIIWRRRRRRRRPRNNLHRALDTCLRFLCRYFDNCKLNGHKSTRCRVAPIQFGLARFGEGSHQKCTHAPFLLIIIIISQCAMNGYRWGEETDNNLWTQINIRSRRRTGRERLGSVSIWCWTRHEMGIRYALSGHWVAGYLRALDYGERERMILSGGHSCDDRSPGRRVAANWRRQLQRVNISINMLYVLTVTYNNSVQILKGDLLPFDCCMLTSKKQPATQGAHVRSVSFDSGTMRKSGMIRFADKRPFLHEKSIKPSKSSLIEPSAILSTFITHPPIKVTQGPSPKHVCRLFE